jgi:hypothetical protein
MTDPRQLRVAHALVAGEWLAVREGTFEFKEITWGVMRSPASRAGRSASEDGFTFVHEPSNSTVVGPVSSLQAIKLAPDRSQREARFREYDTR